MQFKVVYTKALNGHLRALQQQGHKKVVQAVLAGVLMSFFVAGTLVSAQPVATPAVIAEAFADAWNRHDAGALAGLYAADADWVTVAGVRHRGRAAIEAALAAEHPGWARASTLRAGDVSVREVSADHVVVFFWWELADAGRGTPSIQGSTIALVARQDGRWHIVAGQTATPPAPPPLSTKPPAVGPAAPPRGMEDIDVQWLRVPAPNGGTMVAAVARPSGTGPFPVVVLLHGTHGFGPEYVQWARELADGGFLTVAACWFSGGSGPGAGAVSEPISCPDIPPLNRESHPEAVPFIDALMQTARALPGARPDRVALVGHSRGGGEALLYLLAGGKARAAVLHSAGHGHRPETRASEFTTPLLILHGTADGPADGGGINTQIAKVRAFEAALKRHRKVVESMYVEGGGHNTFFTNPAQHAQELTRMLAFLRRHLGK